MSTIFADKFKNTSGGNPVQINQLRGIDTAGSITVQGEGTATTNLQQGLTKQWDKFNQETPAVLDSFNQSSMTDRTTGKTQHHFTSNMTSTHYSVTGMALDEGESQAGIDGCDDDYTDSSKFEVNTMEHGSNSARDCDHGYTQTCGDLA